MHHTSALLSLGAALALTACASTKDAANGATTDTAAADAAAAAPAVTDPQIAAIVVAANTVDIKTGELAKTKSQNPDVVAFADRMIADHTAVNEQAVALVTKLGVTPEENDTSRSLTAGGEEARAKLSALEGAAFDKAYADQEVAYHDAVIKAVDSVLIPNAQNAELAQLLKDVRPALVAHLEHAKQIQTKLAGGVASAAHAGGH